MLLFHFWSCMCFLSALITIQINCKKKKKIYSDYTSLRELCKLIWKWYVCPALCLLFILASSKVNPRTIYDSIQTEINEGGKNSGGSLCYLYSHWICLTTSSQKTSGQKLFQTPMNFKPISLQYLKRAP